MGGEGFEPSKAVPADLQSVPFGHSGIHPYIRNSSNHSLMNYELSEFYHIYFYMASFLTEIILIYNVKT